MLNSAKCHCPYCGEPIEIVVDTSVFDQEYIEDCWVCCRPITIHAIVDDEKLYIEVRTENE